MQGPGGLSWAPRSLHKKPRFLQGTLCCIFPHKADESLESQTNGVPFLQHWRTDGAFLGFFSLLIILWNPQGFVSARPSCDGRASTSPSLQCQAEKLRLNPTPHYSERDRPKELGFVFLWLLAREDSSTGKYHSEYSILTLFLKTLPSGCCHDNCHWPSLREAAGAQGGCPAAPQYCSPRDANSPCACPRALTHTLLRIHSLHVFLPLPSGWRIAWAIIIHTLSTHNTHSHTYIYTLNLKIIWNFLITYSIWESELMYKTN